jgi:predicted amidophosphoribosyltransferase
MLCGRCGHDNRAGAKFCEECAAPLARTCATIPLAGSTTIVVFGQ